MLAGRCVGGAVPPAQAGSIVLATLLLEYACIVECMLGVQTASPAGRGRMLTVKFHKYWGGGCPGPCLARLLPWQAGQRPEAKPYSSVQLCMASTPACNLSQQTGGLVHDRGLCASTTWLGPGGGIHMLLTKEHTAQSTQPPAASCLCARGAMVVCCPPPLPQLAREPVVC